MFAFEVVTDVEVDHPALDDAETERADVTPRRTLYELAYDGEVFEDLQDTDLLVLLLEPV